MTKKGTYKWGNIFFLNRRLMMNLIGSRKKTEDRCIRRLIGRKSKARGTLLSICDMIGKNPCGPRSGLKEM